MYALAYSARLSRSRLSLNLTRTLHGSPRIQTPAQTKGQAPASSRTPKESTHLDQNPHLKHAASSAGGDEGRDVGHGNAAPEPELPSKVRERGRKEEKERKERKVEEEDPTQPDSARGTKKAMDFGMPDGRRGLHTSTWRGAEKHTTDSYSKEVDTNPPASSKTHRVDNAQGDTHRPNEQYADPKKDYATVKHNESYEPPVEGNGSVRVSESQGHKAQERDRKHEKEEKERKVEKEDPTQPDSAGRSEKALDLGTPNGRRELHTSVQRSAEKHTADNYFKDVDTNPPPSNKTHSVDNARGDTHRPNEQYADPQKEYASVSRDEPYEPRVEENGSGTGRELQGQKEQKLRYGGKNRDTMKNAPSREEGADRADAGGRKPEGRD